MRFAATACRTRSNRVCSCPIRACDFMFMFLFYFLFPFLNLFFHQDSAKDEAAREAVFGERGEREAQHFVVRRGAQRLRGARGGLLALQLRGAVEARQRRACRLNSRVSICASSFPRISRSFPVRFGRSRVPTTCTGHVALQNTLRRPSPRHQSQPLSHTNGILNTAGGRRDARWTFSSRESSDILNVICPTDSSTAADRAPIIAKPACHTHNFKRRETRPRKGTGTRRVSETSFGVSERASPAQHVYCARERERERKRERERESEMARPSRGFARTRAPRTRAYFS